jgi:hypothetical protein
MKGLRKKMLIALAGLFVFIVIGLPVGTSNAAASKALPQPKPGTVAAGPKKKFTDIKGGIGVVSDGNGQIRIAWLPPPGPWPAGGFRLEEVESQKVLHERIRPGDDSEAMSRLSAEDRANIPTLYELFAGKKTGKESGDLELYYFALSAKVSTNWDYARAVGMAVLLKDVAVGQRSYRVVGLDANSKPTNLVLTSKAVDAKVVSNWPQPPVDLHAESQSGGINLFWAPPVSKEKIYVATFLVEREIAGQKSELLSDTSDFFPKKWDPKKPCFVDRNAPLETELTYRVSSLDAFGRKSQPALFHFFAVDRLALAAPAMKVTAGANMVSITWESLKNPHTAGYIIERALLRKGPFEILTFKGLDANTTAYEDKAVTGGTVYYYRVRAVGPRGDVGEPGTAVMALPKNKEKPPQPQNLKAEVGRTRVHLSWDPVKFAVGGYIVERKVPGAGRWMLLSLQTRPEPFYDDNFPLHSSGKFSYQVTAVAYDNQQSEPSKPVDVTLLDTLAPNAPYILSIDGSNGKVTLTFKPAPPEEDVYQFLVVRGVSEEDQGLVIGDPLRADSRKFEDTFVSIGQRYWYRMAALDKAGNRSDLGEIRQVTVMNPPIPTPKKPGLKYIKEPAPYILITFDKAPEQHGVVIQRKAAGEEQWETIAGPVFQESQVADIALPKQGKLQYRILYQAINHVSGLPSEAAEIER